MSVGKVAAEMRRIEKSLEEDLLGWDARLQPIKQFLELKRRAQIDINKIEKY